MTYSKKRFFSSAVVALLVVALVLYFVASATIVMGNLSVVGIGGVFMSANQMYAEDVVAYPVMGDIEGTEAVTDTTTCEQRPMLAFELNDASIEGLRIHKDVQIPFFDNQWMSVTVNEPSGGLNGQDLTFYTTQMAIDRWRVTNIELTEGGYPGRGASYTRPSDRTLSDRSGDIWGRDSGEFILITDPVQSTPNNPTSPGDYDNNVTNIKAWLHAVTGQNAEFVGDFNDPSATVDIQISYPNTSDIRQRYENIGIQPETRNPASYNRTEYFDCLPGNN